LYRFSHAPIIQPINQLAPLRGEQTDIKSLNIQQQSPQSQALKPDAMHPAILSANSGSKIQLNPGEFPGYLIRSAV
jgi:hypothetical protein